ncbi:MAG TPA: RNA polymerase subunit sigma-70, partial [Planctomycetaceae bacterium]|nr:RNA polymerase subunit sigma-70 [Planctomycetaceae bacterium]
MSRYLNPAIKQLKDQQVKFAPSEVRLKQLQRAEGLLARIESGSTYRYREVCEQITGFRPEMYPDLVLSADEAAHDLRCFIEDLSDSADLTPESLAERVYTVQDLSRKFNVSTKTVDRWRTRGLVCRRVRIGSRKRIGFLESSVERFLQAHAREIERGSRFSQVSEDERQEIISRARRLARYGGCPTEISRRIARRLGRSAETVRYTLRTFDEEHPELAVFPDANRPLTEEQRKEIYRSLKRGVSASRLSRQYCRTRSSIYRIATEVRAERLLEHPIAYMDSPEFHQPDAEEAILGPPPPGEPPPSRVKPPPGLPPYLAGLYATALLTRDEEAHYFRKMNYLKLRAVRLRESLSSGRPRSAVMDQIEQLLDRADEVKNFLIRS